MNGFLLSSRHDSYLQISKYIQKEISPSPFQQQPYLTLVRLRSRDLVHRAGLIVVDVVKNTRLRAAVQLSANNTLGVVGASARDLEVDALGVHLGAAFAAAAVESDLLVAEDVVSSGDGVGDGDLPERACILC